MASILLAIGIDNATVREQSRQVLLGGGRPAGEVAGILHSG
jgi:hypothetical protein